MRIVRMYSGNLAASQDWKKVEVEVDENDLESILFEIGLDPDKDRFKVSTRTAFKLLTYEAEILLKSTMVQSFAVDVELVKRELQELESRKASVIEQLVGQIGTAADEG